MQLQVLVNMKHVMGDFGFEYRNVDEDRLLAMHIATEMIVANTWFKWEENKLLHIHCVRLEVPKERPGKKLEIT